MQWTIFKKKAADYSSRNKRPLIIAAAVAVILLVADYFAGNASYPIFDSSSRISLCAWLFDDFDGDESFYAINMAFEKELVETSDPHGRVIGNSVITSRHKLDSLLSILDGADYLYIFIDIRFEDGDVSAADSALFARMAHMPRLVYSTHRSAGNFTQDQRVPASKAAYADYRHERLATFSRYEFIQNEHESVALRIYHDITGRDIRRHGPFYTDGTRLCYNTQFIPIPRYIACGTDEYGAQIYPVYALEMARKTPDELRSSVAGKVVIIGDFTNDLHETYIGSVPGPMLSYYAYKTLLSGQHLVSWWLYAAMFALYFFITFALLSGFKLFSTRYVWINVVVALLSWSSVIIGFQLAVFAFTNIAISITFPWLTFSTMAICLEIKKNINSSYR